MTRGMEQKHHHAPCLFASSATTATGYTPSSEASPVHPLGLPVAPRTPNMRDTSAKEFPHELDFEVTVNCKPS